MEFDDLGLLQAPGQHQLPFQEHRTKQGSLQFIIQQLRNHFSYQDILLSLTKVHKLYHRDRDQTDTFCKFDRCALYKNSLGKEALLLNTGSCLKNIKLKKRDNKSIKALTFDFYVFGVTCYTFISDHRATCIFALIPIFNTHGAYYSYCAVFR